MMLKLVLNLYWDFLNYTLLQHIVTEFGAAMENYVMLESMNIIRISG